MGGADPTHPDGKISPQRGTPFLWGPVEVSTVNCGKLSLNRQRWVNCYLFDSRRDLAEHNVEDFVRQVDGLLFGTGSEHKLNLRCGPLTGLRPQMDVRFCAMQEPPAERHTCAPAGSFSDKQCALQSAHRNLVLFS